MGFKIRSSRKILPGVRVNRNGKSTSISVGGKFGRTTINTKTGSVTRTTRIPGTHVSYTTTSGKTTAGQHAASTSTGKPANPLMYKICGIIALVIGTISAFVGLIGFAVGGWVILLIGLLLLYCGWHWMRIAKQNKKQKGE